jgi:hypothetical protein
MHICQKSRNRQGLQSLFENLYSHYAYEEQIFCN